MSQMDVGRNLATFSASTQPPISETRRFWVLVVGAIGCICCSFSYAFNLISDSMQKRYNLSQRDLSTVSTVGLVFQYFVIPYAFLYDFAGPIPIHFLTLLFPLGALLLAFCFQGIIIGTVVRLSVFNAMMGVGCSMFDLGCVITALGYFPANKGAVVALLKTYIGLGSAIVGCIYNAFFTSHTDWYFYFLMAFSIVSGALCVLFMRLPPYHLTQYEQRTLPQEEQEKRLATKAQYLIQSPPMGRLYYGFVILGFLIIFLPLQGALVAYLKLGYNPKVAFAMVTIVVTVAFGVVALPLPCFSGRKREERDDSEVAELGGNAAEPFDLSSKPAAEGEVVQMEIDYIAPQYQEPFTQNIRTLSLWAIFWTLFCVVGAEFVIIFNATYLFGALASEEPDKSLRTLLTVLNGVGSAVGRLLMAYFEVWSQKRKAEDRIPITISLFLPTGSVMIAIVLFLVLPAKALPLPYVVAALGNGFLAAVIILVTRTIYAKDNAKHYHFCFLATMSSTIALNRFLYGEWYTRQANKQNNANQLCFGRGCVLMPLLVMLGMCATAFVSNIYVHVTYSRFCRVVLEERRRLREEGMQPVAELENGFVATETSDDKNTGDARAEVEHVDVEAVAVNSTPSERRA